MKSLIKSLSVGACVVSLMAITTGCGEMSEDATVLDLHTAEIPIATAGEEFGFFEEAPVVEIHGDHQFARGPVLEEHYIDAIEVAEEEEVRPIRPIQAKVTPDNFGEILDAEADDVEKEESAFESGCATSRDWKQLASAVCADGDARLTGFKAAFDCGDGLRGAARFTCTWAANFSEESNSEVYLGLVVGESGECRTIEEHLTEAATGSLCGERPKFAQIEGVSECESSDDDEPLFERVKVVCLR